MLRAHHEPPALFEDIWYWAPLQARETEVDFLLRQGKEYLAIGGKAQPRCATAHLSGLRAIAGLDHLVRRVLVDLGGQRLRTQDGIEVWPLPTFLEAVAADALWP